MCVERRCGRVFDASGAGRPHAPLHERLVVACFALEQRAHRALHQVRLVAVASGHEARVREELAEALVRRVVQSVQHEEHETGHFAPGVEVVFVFGRVPHVAAHEDGRVVRTHVHNAQGALVGRHPQYFR